MLDVTEQLHRYANAVGGLVPDTPNAPEANRQRPLKRLIAVAVAALLAIGGVAVAVNIAEDESRIATEDYADGTLTGTLQLVGGRFGTDPVPVAGTVEVQRLESNETLTVATTSEGRFDVNLAPGEYRLVGSSPQYEAGGQPCRAERTVEVRAGRASAATVDCQMR